MTQYKWVALSNTTLGVMMAMINSTIILISLPAIFKGIDIQPLTSFQYLLWILFGYNIVTATLLVTFGRLSDIFGRVKLYNLGFAVFTAGSLALYLTPGTGYAAADYIILFRIVQGIGGAFLFSNSAAILTDAFPHNERGKALGVNQIAGLAGSLVGLILGGVLASINWRYVFLVSVPFGLFGTVWSYYKLHELSTPERKSRIDYVGNGTFASGLTLLLIGVTYGLLPYGRQTMGWSSPWVIASIVFGIALLAIFPFVELKVQQPMFDLRLFRRRIFTAANFAGMLASIARGGMMIMLIIMLQGIWLPLHGYSYSSTPFWAGIYMIPMMIGFIVMGPLSGWLSDRHGARVLSTAGMGIATLSFILFLFLPYNFSYWEFAALLLMQGIGMGMFASPNTASIMNSVPPDKRGAASGMRATLQNSGQTVSLALFFIIIIDALSSSLPHALSDALTSAGAPSQLTSIVSSLPPTGELFSAFLGYNPIKTLLLIYPALSSSLPPATYALLTSKHWFPSVIASPFMSALREAFFVSAVLSAVAGVASLLRGRVYIYDLEETAQRSEVTAEKEQRDVAVRYRNPSVISENRLKASDSGEEGKEVSGAKVQKGGSR
jgi:EmrB/QacA subfamily drug resistance transporter